MLTPNDSILYWNAVALEANKISHTNDEKEQTGPVLSARALAIVHLAMYEAYARIKNVPLQLPHFYDDLSVTPPTGSPSATAAVAAAAHATLSKLYTKQKAFFDRKHEQAVFNDGNIRSGHDFGLQVAAAILEKRKDDPGVSDDGYAASTARYAHRVDPDNPEQGYHAPFYGERAKLFGVKGTPPMLDPPPQGDPYNHALLQVKGQGISAGLMGTLPTGLPKRSPEQTLIGLFWGYDGTKGLGTPPRLYNQIIRKVADEQANSEEQNAVLFMLVNVAMGDAGILAWKEKYRHDFWRPVVGIREHDLSTGWETTARNVLSEDCDPGWLPLGGPATNSSNPLFTASQTSLVFPFNQITTAKAKNFTPNFPAYPSGHATFGAAAFYITRMVLGQHTSDTSPDTLFNDASFVSEELNGLNQDNNGTVRPRHERNFPNGLIQMIKENGESRVYLGVHWLFDAFAVTGSNDMDLNKKIGGVRLGLDIAKNIFHHYDSLKGNQTNSSAKG